MNAVMTRTAERNNVIEEIACFGPEERSTRRDVMRGSEPTTCQAFPAIAASASISQPCLLGDAMPERRGVHWIEPFGVRRSMLAQTCARAEAPTMTFDVVRNSSEGSPADDTNTSESFAARWWPHTSNFGLPVAWAATELIAVIAWLEHGAAVAAAAWRQLSIVFAAERYAALARASLTLRTRRHIAFSAIAAHPVPVAGCGSSTATVTDSVLPYTSSVVSTSARVPASTRAKRASLKLHRVLLKRGAVAPDAPTSRGFCMFILPQSGGY